MSEFFSSLSRWISESRSWAFSSLGSVPQEAFATLALLAGALGLLKIHASIVRGRLDLPLDTKRLQMVSFRNRVAFFSFLLFLFIWAGEIRAVLLSVAALLAATFIVSKEIISSALAGLLFAASRPAKIGDVIEVSGFCGELVDHSWFYLTLLDASPSGSHSGKLIRVPNSVLLGSSIYNHSISGPWRFSQIIIPCKAEAASEASEIALVLARAAAEPWLEEVRAYRSHLVDSHLLKAPSVEPSVAIRPKDKDTADIVVRFSSPADRRHETEQALLRSFYERLRSLPGYQAKPSSQEAPL